MFLRSLAIWAAVLGLTIWCALIIVEVNALMLLKLHQGLVTTQGGMRE